MTVTSIARTTWVRPTVRAIDWTPLFLVTGTTLAAEGVIGWTGIDPPAFVLYTGLGGLAASAVLGLGDPAQSLLQPLPATTFMRLLHRTALLSASTAFSVCAIVITAKLLDLSPHLGPDLSASLVALAAVGVAVHAIAGAVSHRRHEIAATTILLWVAAAAMPLPAALDVVRLAWLDRPGWVALVAVATTIGGTRRRSA